MKSDYGKPVDHNQIRLRDIVNKLESEGFTEILIMAKCEEGEYFSSGKMTGHELQNHLARVHQYYMQSMFDSMLNDQLPIEFMG